MSENIENFDSTQNNDGAERARRGRLIVVALLVIAVIAVVVFGIIRLNGADQTPGAAPTSTAEPTTDETPEEDGGDMIVQPGNDELAKLSGQELLDALGERVDGVAKRNGMTAGEFTDLVLRDSTVRVMSNGTIYHVDAPR